MKSEKEIHGKREIKSLLHYCSKVSYHLSSRFWGDKSCFSRDVFRFSQGVSCILLTLNELCTLHNTLSIFTNSDLVSIAIFVRSPVTASTNKHLILCRRKIFQRVNTGKSIVYKRSCKSVMEIVEKMISPVTSRSCKCQNTTIYRWRQELLLRFLRWVVGISFKLFCQGKFCLAARVNELLMLMNFLIL